MSADNREFTLHFIVAGCRTSASSDYKSSFAEVTSPLTVRKCLSYYSDIWAVLELV